MSTAYPLRTVQVVEVSTPDGLGIKLHSLWRQQNLLFLNREEGLRVLQHISHWARAVDEAGRYYLIWVADHPRHQGLVIQPFDSRYCYEVFPEAVSGEAMGRVMKKVVPFPGRDSQVNVP